MPSPARDARFELVTFDHDGDRRVQPQLGSRPNGRANELAMARKRTPRGWPLERVLFALAGTMTLLSALLAAVVSPWFLLLSAVVGVNQWAYVLVGACPASIVLRRAFGLRPARYSDPHER